MFGLQGNHLRIRCLQGPQAPATPPHVVPLSATRADIYGVDLSTTCAIAAQYESSLSCDELERAARFIFARDRNRFIAARALLRCLLGSYLEAPPQSLRFTYGAHGKPALDEPFSASGLRFNVSHADDFAVYALSWGREVGVDIESVRPLDDADAIAARFFSPREKRAYLRREGRDRTLAFFNCWTRKEAVLKALGEGLSFPLDRFEVSLAPELPPSTVRIEGNGSVWRMETFMPGPAMVGALAVQE